MQGMSRFLAWITRSPNGEACVFPDATFGPILTAMMWVNGEAAVSRQPLRVLVVDDDQSLRTLLRITFEVEGVEVVEASDGESALQLMAERLPECVVLDWRMPGLDGPEVLRRMATQRSLAEIPVVVVSACPEHQVDQKALPIRPLHWIAKPFSPVELVERLRAVLRTKATDLSLEPAYDYSTDVSDRVELSPPEPCTNGFEATMTEEQIRLYVRDLHDALERERQRVAELEDARGKLQRLDTTKTAFLDFISHELRTPLQQMSVITLLDDATDPADLEVHDILRRGYDRLCQFVEEGLCYIDALAQEHAVEPRVPVEILAVFTREFGEIADGDLLGGRDPGGLWVDGEPVALATAIGRLRRFTDNAVAPSTTADVRLREGSGSVCVEITIFGPCMSPAEIADVFDPFHRHANAENVDAAGLDLPIARELVRRQGGAIDVQATPAGDALTIRVTLPLLEGPLLPLDAGDEARCACAGR